MYQYFHWVMRRNHNRKSRLTHVASVAELHKKLGCVQQFTALCEHCLVNLSSMPYVMFVIY